MKVRFKFELFQLWSAYHSIEYQISEMGNSFVMMFVCVFDKLSQILMSDMVFGDVDKRIEWFVRVLHYNLVSCSFLELISLSASDFFHEEVSSMGEALRLEVFKLVHQL